MSTLPADRRLDAQPVNRTDAPALLVDTTIRVPAHQIAADHEDALAEANTFKAVKTAADYEYAVDLLRRLKAGAKAVAEFYLPHKRAIDSVKRTVLDDEQEQTADFETHGRRINGLAQDWFRTEQARERAAREAAEREAAARAQAERDAQVSRLKRAAESVPDANVQAAIQQEAAQLAKAPLADIKPAFQSAIPQVKGYTPIRETWSARVDDLMALVRAVAAGEVPIDALQPNQPYLNERAVMAKDALRIPGVTAVKTEGSAVRT